MRFPSAVPLAACLAACSQEKAAQLLDRAWAPLAALKGGTAAPVGTWPARPETDAELGTIMERHAELQDRFSTFLRTAPTDLEALAQFRPRILEPSQALIDRMGRVARYGDERDAALESMSAMLQTQHQAYLLGVEQRSLPPRPLLDALEAKVRQAVFHQLRVTRWFARMSRKPGPRPLSEIVKEFYGLSSGQVASVTCRVRIDEWRPMADAARWDFLSHVPWEVRASLKGCSARPLMPPGIRAGEFSDEFVETVGSVIRNHYTAVFGPLFLPAWHGLAAPDQSVSAVDGWYSLAAAAGAPSGVSLRLREDLRRLEIRGLPGLERLDHSFGERAGLLVPLGREEPLTEFSDFDYTLLDGALLPMRSTFRAKDGRTSVSFRSEACSFAF